MTWISRALLIGLMIFTAGCYGESITIPNYISTIYIPMFVSNVPQRNLDIEVTRAITDEFLRDGRLRIVQSESEAQSSLKGTITGYQLIPVAWDVNNRVSQYFLKIQCTVEFYDRVENRLIIRDDTLDGETTFSLIASPPETEDDAIRRASEELAKDIFFVATEGRQFEQDEIRFHPSGSFGDTVVFKGR